MQDRDFDAIDVRGLDEEGIEIFQACTVSTKVEPFTRVRIAMADNSLHDTDTLIDIFTSLPAVAIKRGTRTQQLRQALSNLSSSLHPEGGRMVEKNHFFGFFTTRHYVHGPVKYHEDDETSWH